MQLQILPLNMNSKDDEMPKRSRLAQMGWRCFVSAFICVLYSAVWSTSALAWVTVQRALLLTPEPKSYSGPSDSAQLGGLIADDWITKGDEWNMFSCGPALVIAGQCNESWIWSVKAPLPLTTTWNGVTYSVFDTGVPGIGYIVGIKDTHADAYTPMGGSANQSFDRRFLQLVLYTIGFNAHITFVKTSGHLQSGTYVIPAQSVAYVSAKDNLGNEKVSTIDLAATTLTLKARACTVNSSQQNVELGTVTPNDLPSVGSVSATKDVTIALTCDDQVHLNATVSDQSNLANTSPIVSLSSDSTGSGVGVQVLYGDSEIPVELGPDDTSEGATHQFKITDVSGDGSTVTVPLRVRYVRTGDLKGGTANALAGVTFSYQ